MPGGPTEQHPLGNLGTELLEFLRVLEEIDDLLQLELGVRHVGDILEGGAHLRLVEALGRAADVIVEEAAAQRIAEARQDQEEKQGAQQR